jgi:hypothetical protein
MIGKVLPPQRKIEARFGAGAVMLAVDELGLRVANGDSATALSRHEPNAAHGTPQPSSVTDVHAGR